MSKKNIQKPAPESEQIISIKGTDANLQCRGFQFEIGKTYSVPGDIRACENGFHACPSDQHPLSVFDYYPPAGSRFFEVTQGGKSHREGSKLASAQITIGIELSLSDLAARAVKWVFDRAKWKEGSCVAGDNEAATASGDQAAATASGDQGAATASGYQGAATASGYQGAATASGYAAKVRGAEGCALFLVERDGNFKIIAVWAGIAGRAGIKPNAFYSLVDGKPVEVEN